MALYCLRIKCKPFSGLPIHALAWEGNPCVCHAWSPSEPLHILGHRWLNEWCWVLGALPAFRAVILRLSGNSQSGPGGGRHTASMAAVPWPPLSFSWQLSIPLLAGFSAHKTTFHWVWNYVFIGPSICRLLSTLHFPIMSTITRYRILFSCLRGARRHRPYPFFSPLWLQAKAVGNQCIFAKGMKEWMGPRLAQWQRGRQAEFQERVWPSVLAHLTYLAQLTVNIRPSLYFSHYV